MIVESAGSSSVQVGASASPGVAPIVVPTPGLDLGLPNRQTSSDQMSVLMPRRRTRWPRR